MLTVEVRVGILLFVVISRPPKFSSRSKQCVLRGGPRYSPIRAAFEGESRIPRP